MVEFSLTVFCGIISLSIIAGFCIGMFTERHMNKSKKDKSEAEA